MVELWECKFESVIKIRAAAVPLRWSTCLLIYRSWARVLLGAKLFTHSVLLVLCPSTDPSLRCNITDFTGKQYGYLTVGLKQIGRI